MKKITEEAFINKLPKFILETYVILNKYDGDNTIMYLQHKQNNFIFKVKAGRLIRKVKTPLTIETCTNKTEYFKYLIYDVNPNLKVIGEYINENVKILVEDKQGLKYLVFPRHLYRKYSPTIQATINKEDIYRNKIKKVYGDTFILTETNYITHRIPVTIKCKIHGKFSIYPNRFLKGKGCPKCNKTSKSCGWSYSNWINKGLISDSFDSYKVYVVECWNEYERFIKIGRTFNTIGFRFGKGLNKTLPYRYKVLHVTEGDGLFICNLEHYLIDSFKKHKYSPEISFYGENECFKIEIKDLYKHKIDIYEETK